MKTDYYKNIKNKINLEYYLHLSKQIIDRVNKNIYDLTYLTDLPQESKTAITENMKENLNKFNQFFNMKFKQFVNEDDYNDLYSSEFAFLGRKRNGFISRNKFQENTKSHKNDGFLKFLNLGLDAKCFEPQGVKYSISDNENLNEDDYDLFDFNDLNTIEDFLTEENNGNKINKQTNHKYMNISSSENKREEKRRNVNFKKNLSSNKSLILKYNNPSNPTRKIITIHDIFDNKNQNINSLYCKDYVSYSKENTEFFKRLFAKLNREKPLKSMEDEYNMNQQNLGDLLGSEKNEKINFTEKNDDDCLYMHMILPERNYLAKNISSEQDNFFTNSSSFKTNNYFSETRDKFNDKQVYYEVGCKIFEINKIYK